MVTETAPTFLVCIFQMYESGPVKQTGAIALQPAGAPGVLFQAPSSAAGAGQYVTMVTHSLCCYQYADASRCR